MVNRVMSVSERRYLKENSTVFCSGQIFGVCSKKPLGICKWSVKAQIFDHLPESYRYRLEEIVITIDIIECLSCGLKNN